MSKKSLPLSEVYRHLEPGPVVLLSTAQNGKPNIMTMSWHTMIDFTPPIVGCVVSENDFTFDILKKTKECVINIPTVKLLDQVVKIGNTSGEKLDKFKKFGLTSIPASRVKAPLIGECYASFECKVIDIGQIKKYNLFIVEVVKAWVDPRQKQPRTLHHRGKGVFMVAGKTVKTESKMK